MEPSSLSPVSNRVEVCQSDEVPEGGRLVLDVGEVTIGLFRLKGELHAYLNSCPHQGGPVCQGLVIGAVEETLGPGGETVARHFDEADLRIVCPWHGFEFSIATGRHPAAKRYALRRFPVEEEDGAIHVTV